MKKTPVVKILQPSGILDKANAAPLRQQIMNEVENGTDILLVDLKNVTFMDSAGLAGLVLALKTVRAGGSTMFLCSMSEPIKTLFELTNMNRVFQIYSTKDEFTKAIFLAQ